MKEHVFKQLFLFLKKRQRIEFGFVLLILAVSAVLTQLTPLAIGYLTDHVLTQQGIHVQTAVAVLLMILIVNIFNEVIKVIRRLLVEDTATYVEKTARQQAADALLKAPLSYFRIHMTGNIHGRLNRSLEGTSKLIKLIFMDFAPAVANGVASIVVIFSQLPLALAFITLLVIPTGVLIVFRQISTQKGIRIELMETKASMDGTMVELLGGIETIRSFDSAHLESSRIEQRSEFLRKKEMKHHKAMAFYDCLKFINETVFNVFVIAASVFLASQHIISIGTVLTAYLCFTQLTGPLRELHRILDEFSESMVLADDYFSIMHLPQDFSYSTCASQPLLPQPAQIVLNQIDFAYPEKPDTKILDHLTLSIRQGEFLGIAGPSGCGKSSLIKILDRLEPCDGDISLNQRSLQSYSRAELADCIALVPQTPFLIADTVFNNICYGLTRPVTLEEVQDAARKACIDHVIEALPEQYQFLLSEGGRNVSGGQRQRIALARIFLRKPKILILDEATSALDNTSERFIQKEIEKMNRELGTTVISIAHRLSTLENCDEIIVMNNGQIAQKGTYETLKNEPGIFQDMLRGILK